MDFLMGLLLGVSFFLLAVVIVLINHLNRKNSQHLDHEPTYVRKKPKQLVKDVLVFIVCGLVFFINLSILDSNNKVIAMSAFIFILAIAFLALMFLHRSYERFFGMSHPYLVLFVGHLILAVTMILNHYNYFSAEWALAGFIITTVLFYDFKIDSRFLILPALLLLAYIPFMLLGKYSDIAEQVAIFVYYLLATGICLQFIEFRNEKDLRLEFEATINKILKQKYFEILIITVGLFSAVIIILNRFFQFDFIKWTGIYLFFVMLGFYFVSWMQKGEI